jgi:hypothetical protein
MIDSSPIKELKGMIHSHPRSLLLRTLVMEGFVAVSCLLSLYKSERKTSHLGSVG